jgi:hypothetical protein
LLGKREEQCQQDPAEYFFNGQSLSQLSSVGLEECSPAVIYGFDRFARSFIIDLDQMSLDECPIILAKLAPMLE